MEKKAVANKDFFLCYLMSYVDIPQTAKNCKNKLVVRGFSPPKKSKLRILLGFQNKWWPNVDLMGKINLVIFLSFLISH